MVLKTCHIYPGLILHDANLLSHLHFMGHSTVPWVCCDARAYNAENTGNGSHSGNEYAVSCDLQEMAKASCQI